MSGSLPQDAPTHSRSALSLMLLRLSIALALAGAVFLILFFNGSWPAELGAAQVGLAAAAAFPLMLGSVLVAGCRLAVLAGGFVSFRDGMAVNAIAQFIVLLVPSRLSEAAKPIGLNLRCGLPPASGFAVLVVERLLDTAFLAVLACGSVAMAMGPYAGPLRSSATALAIVATIGLCGLVALAFRPGLLQRAAALTRWPWLTRQAQQVAGPLARLADPHAAGWAIGLSALSWLLSYLIFFAVIRIAGLEGLSAGAILVVFVASTLGLVISVAPGGLGTFEGAIVLALSAFNIPVPTAIATALLLRLCLILPTVVAAGWFLSTSRDTVSALIRRLKERRDTR